ncbi:MAG TPA: beta-phosphoglucomutase family hydrolase [Candidatus Dormibacteraeota bacterium]|nr:beta-phosphoglucomutase family hydrolase [Candidatus Dormibacteraeota bacterium]
MSLGLPPQVAACLFDLDGVITKTAIQHAKAWKQVFEKHGIAFDEVADYDAYVDGKPREDGVRSVLKARHIAEDQRLVDEIARDKDHLFLELIHKEGVETYPSSVTYIERAKHEGLKVAVVSSSKHTTDVLKAAKLDHLFDAQVDGIVAEREHLKGKPNPDTYEKAAHLLGAVAHNAAVYEDALAGVEAGRAGHFGLVVGVDRAGQAAALKQHGADIVVKDLAELMR